MKLVCNLSNYIFNGKLKHISRFSIVGILNTLIDFLVFTIFNELTRVGYMGSQVLGYSFGVLNSFIFNKKWTFKDSKLTKSMIYEFLQFIVINVISLFVTIFGMNLLVKNFELNVYVSKIIVTLIAQLVNFISYKYMVFR